MGKSQVQMKEEILTCIRNAPVPMTKRQVRSFLGLAGCYWRFIPNYADEVVPLTNLTKKGQPNQIPGEAFQQREF